MDRLGKSPYALNHPICVIHWLTARELLDSDAAVVIPTTHAIGTTRHDANQ